MSAEPDVSADAEDELEQFSEEEEPSHLNGSSSSKPGHVRIAKGNAEPLGRISDLERLPFPWMRELLWAKRSEGNGATKIAWYAPKSCTANAITILTHDERWQGVLARNDFAEVDVTLAAPPWHAHEAAGSSLGEWTDPDTTRLGAWFDRAYGMSLNVGMLERVVSVAAEARRFHPVREYLRGLKWDGKQRLPSLLSTYFAALATPYSSEVGKRWMISAVARVMCPGCQADCTMVLEGKQGIGKNRALRALVPDPEWYAETGITIGEKDAFQNIRGKWIYLLDELDSLNRAELNRVKGFLTSPSDTYRESYGKRSRNHPRQTIFCGTTNEDEWLTDTTGNRRFWPVRAHKRPDVDGILRDRDQLWAEALARYESNEPWHVNTPELQRLCEEEQGDRVQKDIWLPTIAAWLENPIGWTWGETADNKTFKEKRRVDTSNGVLTSEVAMYALEKPVSQITNADAKRIAGVLDALKYVRGGQRRENGVRVRRYVLASPASPTDTTQAGDSGTPKNTP